MSIGPLVIYHIETSPDLTYGLYFGKEDHHVPFPLHVGISSVNILRISGFYRQITLRHISGKNNYVHTNVNHGHQESNKVRGSR